MVNDPTRFVYLLCPHQDKDRLPTSRVLVDEAIRRGSSDNITCLRLVIHLKIPLDGTDVEREADRRGVCAKF
jgi:hypothetical protein